MQRLWRPKGQLFLPTRRLFLPPRLQLGRLCVARSPRWPIPATGTTATAFLVSGAGTSAGNGVYVLIGSYGGWPLYSNGTYYLNMSGGAQGWWITYEIGGGTGAAYQNNCGLTGLPTSGTWAVAAGASPAPTVTAYSSGGGGPSTCNITYVGVGAAASAGSNTSMSPALPSGWAMNDIFLLIVQSNEATATPTGWNLVKQTQASNTSEYLSLFYRRAQSGDTAPTVAGANHQIQMGCIAAWRGCIATGNPVDVASANWGQNASSGHSLQVSAITTLTAYDLVVFLGIFFEVSGGPSTYSSWTSGGPTPAADFAITDGNLDDFFAAQFVQATAGSTGACSVTESGGVGNYADLNGLLVALKTS